MPRRSALRVPLVLAALLAAVAAVAAGCTATPRQMAYVNDELNQAADAVNNLRTEIGVLQSSLDSLRTVVAKQDSTIVRMAAVTNVTVVR